MMSFPWIKNSHQDAAALILSVIAALLLMSPIPSFAQETPQKHLLVLHSYHRGYKWTDDITKGIESAFKSHQNLRVHYEYMDTKIVSGDVYFAFLSRLYRYKFEKIRFDVILASDNDALDFLVKYRDELFPGTPVVFCGVNFFDKSILKGKSLFTGVNEDADLKATIDVALRLHPNTRQIVVINDTTKTGLIMHDRLIKLLPRYQEAVKFVFLEDVDMAEIQARVEQLSQDSLVLFTIFSRDKSGRFLEFDESISLVAEKCKVPIYSTWDFNLGYGIVGGMLTSGYFQGETAARMVIRILRGEKVDKIPIEMKSPNRYMFDYRQMQRFRIEFAPLPEGSITVNKPSPLYSLPKNIVWSNLAVLTTLAVIILILLRKAAQRRRLMKALEEDLGLFRTAFEEAPVGIAQVETDGRLLRVNRKFCEIVGYREDELFREALPDSSRSGKLDAGMESLRQLLEDGIKISPVRKRYTRKDGSAVWLDVTASPVCAPSGEPQHHICIIAEHVEKGAGGFQGWV